MTTQTTAPALVVEREIEATAEELFDAWLDPESLAVWMRPGDTVSATVTADPHVGGEFSITMHSKEKSYAHTGVYRIIDRPNKLVFTWISDATHHGESLVTVDFRQKGKTTRLILTHELLPVDKAEAHRGGWTSALDKLADMTNEKARKGKL